MQRKDQTEMKKKYTKPQIVFENFSLSTSIAGACEVKTHTPAARECGYDMGGYTVFLTDITGCSFKIEENKYGFCYHVPIDTNNLFNS